jgi:hypothetical protein
MIGRPNIVCEVCWLVEIIEIEKQEIETKSCVQVQQFTVSVVLVVPPVHAHIL